MYLPQQKIDPRRVAVDTDGMRFRHLVVDLTERLSIADAREQPELWSRVQERQDLKVKRGDRVTLVSSDGLTIADQCVVLRAQGGSAWLGAPLRMITLEEVGLFSDGLHQVVPNGVGYSVCNIRSGRVGDRIFNSEEAAKSEILKRQPRVA